MKGQGLEILMVESNLHSLNINVLAIFKELDELATLMMVELFATSPSYIDISYVLHNYKPLLV